MLRVEEEEEEERGGRAAAAAAAANMAHTVNMQEIRGLSRLWFNLCVCTPITQLRSSSCA